ncbi:hypothetical protein JCM10908_004780 [Rhodotorula pacifica]|uniref:uncharacterized protein n=1 Tax=Rhodotorula pacifica TaxID=1495444 RepID=UPI00316B596E
MELEITGSVLKHFRSALTCLSRLGGEDLDFTCTSERVSVSTVNSSRTAFGIVHFYPRFFARYDIQADNDYRGNATGSTAAGGGDKFRFSVTAKALLSTLRPRSANTVESCTISVHDSEDPHGHRRGGQRRRQHHHEPGVESGECRIVVYLHCQHGVRKKHSLTYSHPSVQSWARFDLNTAPCNWTASSRVLKDWMMHFHDRSGGGGAGGGSGAGGGGGARGGGGGGTDEVTFYCSRGECRLKSFNDVDRSGPTNDMFTSRSLSTEVTVDTQDFDTYHVPSPRVVTFAQKEFKAIINLAEPLQAPLTATFSTGGRPIMFSLSGDRAGSFEAKFVIATTDFDSGGGGVGEDGIKREKSESVAQLVQRQKEKQQGGGRAADPAGNDARRHGGGTGPLFNAPTPSPAPPDPRAYTSKSKGKGKGKAAVAEDDFDAAFEDDAAAMDDAFFADLDRATQQALEGASQSQMLAGGGSQMEEVKLRSGVGKANGASGEVWSYVAAAAGVAHGGSGGGGSGDRERAQREQTEEDGPARQQNGHAGEGSDYGGGHEEFVWDHRQHEEEAEAEGETQLGPTQHPRDPDNDDDEGLGSDGDGGGRRSVKRAKWNLLGDG